MVCYHPIFSEKYYLAQIFLNKFKEELTQNDTLSLFSYSRRKLKKNLDRKYIDNINLEENIDTYLKTDVSIENRYSLNFFQRLWNYLDHNHDETIKQLCSKNYKNLIIAFTSENEWKNFNLDRKTKEFLRKLEIDKEKFGDSYFLWIIIIILPEKSHSVYIGEYYDFESSNSDSICLNGENIYDENSESDQSDESEFISKLKREIKVNHPISIVHVKEKNESIRNAINFVTNFIQISKFKPLRMSFQNLLG